MKKYHKTFVIGDTVIATIPKAACSSIHKALYEAGYAHTWTEDTDFNGKRVMVLTRNPFDRLVSFYHNKILSSAKRLWTEVNLDDFGMYLDMPFEEMVYAVASLSDEDSDRHFRSQTQLLRIDGRFFPTDLWQFGLIDEFWKEVQTIARVGNLPQKNTSKGRNHYRAYYNEDLRRVVEKRYAEDFFELGYDF